MTSGRSDLIEIHDLGIQAETDKAICVSRDGTEAIWLPRSQVEFEKTGKNIWMFEMPEWLAHEKGLI